MIEVTLEDVVEDYDIFVTDLKSGKATDLTPFEKIAARIEGVSWKVPGKVLIGINNRNPQLHDTYEVTIATGKSVLKTENPGFVSFMYDDDFRLKLGMTMSPDGGSIYKRFNPNKKDPKEQWEDYLTIGQEDMLTTTPLGFDKTGRYLYMWDSRGRDTGALVIANMKFGQAKVLAETWPH